MQYLRWWWRENAGIGLSKWRESIVTTQKGMLWRTTKKRIFISQKFSKIHNLLLNFNFIFKICLLKVNAAKFMGEGLISAFPFPSFSSQMISALNVIGWIIQKIYNKWNEIPFLS